MAADEAVRSRLHRKLDELRGPEEAALLMTGVPPFPWAEVARRRDLELLRTELRAEIRESRGEVLAEIGSQTWKIVLANTASTATIAAAVVAAVRL